MTWAHCHTVPLTWAVNIKQSRELLSPPLTVPSRLSKTECKSCWNNWINTSTTMANYKAYFCVYVWCLFVCVCTCVRVVVCVCLIVCLCVCWCVHVCAHVCMCLCACWAYVPVCARVFVCWCNNLCSPPRYTVLHRSKLVLSMILHLNYSRETIGSSGGGCRGKKREAVVLSLPPPLHQSHCVWYSDCSHPLTHVKPGVNITV